jgi:lipopolysaccharide transport system permease protein
MLLRNTIELIFYKAYTDIKAEASRSYLGLLWWIIEPIMYMCAFYILFVLVLHQGGTDFVPTFLCAAVVWKWFDSGLRGGSQSITANRGLLQQVYVPKYTFPIIAVLGSTARFIPVFLILMVYLLLSGITVQTTWFAVPALMLTQFCLVISLALLAGAITPFLPDLKVAIENGLMMLFFLSGVFFDINTVQEPLRSYLLINPMAGLIIEYRNTLLHGIWPDYTRLSLILLSSLAICGCSLILLKRMDHQYGKVGF